MSAQVTAFQRAFCKIVGDSLRWFESNTRHTSTTVRRLAERDLRKTSFTYDALPLALSGCDGAGIG